MAANVQGKGRRQREREDNGKRIKREERKKKRKPNEELKMKRMQERSDKQKKKDEEKQQKAQAKIHKCDCTVHETYKRKKASGQLVRVRVGLSAHVVTTKYTCLVSERHTFNMLRGTMMTMTMTLSSFVLAAFGLMTTAQSTRMPVSLIK